MTELIVASQQAKPLTAAERARLQREVDDAPLRPPPHGFDDTSLYPPGVVPADDAEDVREHWDTEHHPRGKTSPESTPGSFAPGHAPKPPAKRGRLARQQILCATQGVRLDGDDGSGPQRTEQIEADSSEDYLWIMLNTWPRWDQYTDQYTGVVSDAAEARINKICDLMQRLTDTDNHEYCALIDNTTGEVVGGVIERGGMTSVATRVYRQTDPQKTYTSIHTHPTRIDISVKNLKDPVPVTATPGAHSDADLQNFLVHPSVSSSIVVAGETRYRIDKTPRTTDRLGNHIKAHASLDTAAAIPLGMSEAGARAAQVLEWYLGEPRERYLSDRDFATAPVHVQQAYTRYITARNKATVKAVETLGCWFRQTRKRVYAADFTLQATFAVDPDFEAKHPRDPSGRWVAKGTAITDVNLGVVNDGPALEEMGRLLDEGQVVQFRTRSLATGVPTTVLVGKVEQFLQAPPGNHFAVWNPKTGLFATGEIPDRGTGWGFHDSVIDRLEDMRKIMGEGTVEEDLDLDYCRFTILQEQRTLEEVIGTSRRFTGIVISPAFDKTDETLDRSYQEVVQATRMIAAKTGAKPTTKILARWGDGSYSIGTVKNPPVPEDRSNAWARMPGGQRGGWRPKEDWFRALAASRWTYYAVDPDFEAKHPRGRGGKWIAKGARVLPIKLRETFDDAAYQQELQRMGTALDAGKLVSFTIKSLGTPDVTTVMLGKVEQFLQAPPGNHFGFWNPKTGLFATGTVRSGPGWGFHDATINRLQEMQTVMGQDVTPDYTRFSILGKPTSLEQVTGTSGTFQGIVISPAYNAQDETLDRSYEDMRITARMLAAKTGAKPDTPILARWGDGTYSIGTVAELPVPEDRSRGWTRMPGGQRGGWRPQKWFTQDDPAHVWTYGLHTFGTVQIDLPDAAAAQVLAAAQAIPTADLAGEGREPHAHITVRYGLLPGVSARALQAVLQAAQPFTATLGPTRVFPPSEHSDNAAVVVVPVRAPDLHTLHAALTETQQFQPDNFPDYQPHATLAYIRPDVAEAYVDHTWLDGVQFVVDTVTVIEQGGNVHRIPLGAADFSLAFAVDPEFETKHPRGPGGKWTDKPGAPHEDLTARGARLPNVVFRGAGPSNLESSQSWAKGVYVSTSREAAAQWGTVHAVRLTRQPKLLDLDNWYGVAKSIVAHAMGENPMTLDRESFDTMIGDAFIQMPDALIARLKKNGYDGARLGQDAFLIGKLSDFGMVTAEHAVDPEFETKHPRGPGGKWIPKGAFKPGASRGAAAGPDKQASTWTPEDGGLLFHGTRKGFTRWKTGAAYLTDDYDEAGGYARGMVPGTGLGTRGGAPMVRTIQARPGATVDANPEINAAISEGDFGPETLEGIIQRARSSGARYVTYEHPSNVYPDREQRVIIALYPNEDLKFLGGWSLDKKLAVDPDFESLHPRAPEGTPQGGTWINKPGRVAPISGAGTGRNAALVFAAEAREADMPASVRDEMDAVWERFIEVPRDEAVENVIELYEQARLTRMTEPKKLGSQIHFGDTPVSVAEAYARWYNEVHDWTVAEAQNAGLDPHVAAAVVAACSQNINWEENQKLAQMCFGMLQDLDEEIPEDVRDAANAKFAEKHKAKPGQSKERIGVKGVTPRYTVEAGTTLRDLLGLATDATRSPRDRHEAGIVAGVLLNSGLGAKYLPEGVKGTAALGTYEGFVKGLHLAYTNDPRLIDRTLDGIKTRSFYNIIDDPTSDDVAIDRHMWRALSAGTTLRMAAILRNVTAGDASNALGASPAYNNALIGAYPIGADVIREATRRINAKHGTTFKPSQVQAIAWGQQLERWPRSWVQQLTEFKKAFDKGEVRGGDWLGRDHVHAPLTPMPNVMPFHHIAAFAATDPWHITPIHSHRGPMDAGMLDMLTDADADEIEAAWDEVQRLWARGYRLGLTFAGGARTLDLDMADFSLAIVADPEFETKHPRGEGGKWTEKPARMPVRTVRVRNMDQDFETAMLGHIEDLPLPKDPFYIVVALDPRNGDAGAAGHLMLHEVLIEAIAPDETTLQRDRFAHLVLQSLGTPKQSLSIVLPYRAETDAEERADLRGILDHLQRKGVNLHLGDMWVTYHQQANTMRFGTGAPPGMYAVDPEFEAKHPRAPEGSSQGGKFIDKPGAVADRPLWAQTQDEATGPYPTSEWTPETTREHDSWHERRRAWEAAVRVAISLGELDVAEAERLGFRTAGSEKYAPLPDTLYHVTTNLPAVQESGLLKTRDELHQREGAGLGGGDSDTISFTADLATAEAIRRALLEARAVARGEITAADILKEAAAGTQAERPWIYNLAHYHDRNYKPGDPLPERLVQLAHGYEEKTFYDNHMDFFTADTLPPGAKTDPAREQDIGDGKRGWSRIWVPMDAKRLQHETFQLWHESAFLREEAGGPLYPLFFSSDTAALARTKPSDIGILQVTPNPKATGFQVSALGEWRTHSGRAVRIVRAFALEDAVEELPRIVAWRDDRFVINPVAWVEQNAYAVDPEFETLHPRDPQGQWVDKPSIDAAPENTTFLAPDPDPAVDASAHALFRQDLHAAVMTLLSYPPPEPYTADPTTTNGHIGARNVTARLSELTELDGREYAAMVDMRTGALIGGGVAQGNDRGVSTARQLIALAQTPGREVIDIHTHPRGDWSLDGPSFDDLHHFLMYGQIRRMVIRTPRATVVIDKIPSEHLVWRDTAYLGTLWQDGYGPVLDMIRACHRAADCIEQKVQPQYQQWMQAVAKNLDLRYRVVPHGQPVRYVVADPEFEAKHPRGRGGLWTEKGGGTAVVDAPGFDAQAVQNIKDMRRGMQGTVAFWLRYDGSVVGLDALEEHAERVRATKPADWGVPGEQWTGRGFPSQVLDTNVRVRAWGRNRVQEIDFESRADLRDFFPRMQDLAKRLGANEDTVIILAPNLDPEHSRRYKGADFLAASSLAELGRGYALDPEFERKHPRGPKGTLQGGRWIEKPAPEYKGAAASAPRDLSPAIDKPVTATAPKAAAERLAAALATMPVQGIMHAVQANYKEYLDMRGVGPCGPVAACVTRLLQAKGFDAATIGLEYNSGGKFTSPHYATMVFTQGKPAVIVDTSAFQFDEASPTILTPSSRFWARYEDVQLVKGFDTATPGDVWMAKDFQWWTQRLRHLTT